MKKPRPHIPLPSNSRKWILSRCKHPKTLSFAVNQTRKPEPTGDAATLSDVDSFLYENFKSLYLDDQESRTNAQTTENRTGSVRIAPVRQPASRSLQVEPVLRRSWSSVTGASSSTTTTTSTTTNNNDSKSSSIPCNRDDEGKEVQLPEQCIAVLTQSTSPVEDLRRSMEEGIDAKLQEEDNKIEWEYMEELLFCYLNMNDKKSYKYILSALVDQIVVLREMDEEGAPARSRINNRRDN